ncbi:MAG: hypothetical protein J0L94_02285 [Rhodothermia bacterium]|nr:hypothetical protein [Rhodothermia bacterium]
MNDFIEGMIGVFALTVVAAIPISIFFFRYKTQQLAIEAKQTKTSEAASESLSRSELTTLIQQAVSDSVEPLTERIESLERKLEHSSIRQDFRDGLIDALPDDEPPPNIRSVGRQPSA